MRKNILLGVFLTGTVIGELVMLEAMDEMYGLRGIIVEILTVVAAFLAGVYAKD